MSMRTCAVVGFSRARLPEGSRIVTVRCSGASSRAESLARACARVSPPMSTPLTVMPCAMRCGCSAL
jgi:hypothetical protein